MIPSVIFVRLKPVHLFWFHICKNVFCFCIFVESRCSEFTTDPRLLISTPRCVRKVDAEVIHPHRTLAHTTDTSLCLSQVGCPHSTRESINVIIGQSNGFYFRSECFNGHNRTKTFIFYNRHVCCAVSKHS